MRRLTSAALCCALLLLPGAEAAAQLPAQHWLRCGPFSAEALAPPQPREAASAVRRFEDINAAVRTQPYRVLYFGDSLTERFDPLVWAQSMTPRGVLNAGVNGDRTEHLLWRLQHGNLAGPPPPAIVLLIGTNDLTNGGNGRSPEVTADGIRRDLLYLRRQLPGARILLLGLWPRGASRDGRLRQGTVAVNRLIRSCSDAMAVDYEDIGGVLLNPDGRLDRTISPDLLHFSRIGYERLVRHLDPLIDRLLAGR